MKAEVYYFPSQKLQNCSIYSKTNVPTPRVPHTHTINKLFVYTFYSYVYHTPVPSSLHVFIADMALHDVRHGMIWHCMHSYNYCSRNAPIIQLSPFEFHSINTVYTPGTLLYVVPNHNPSVCTVLWICVHYYTYVPHHSYPYHISLHFERTYQSLHQHQHFH